MENSQDYIYFKDRNHLFTGASQAFVNLTPSKHWTDLLGKSNYDVFPENYADTYHDIEKQVFNGSYNNHEILEFIDNQGNKGWVKNLTYPLLDNNKDIIGLPSNFTPLDIKNVIIWGNHSETMVPDISHAKILIQNNWLNLFDIEHIKDILTDEWINNELTPLIKQRGKSVISKRKLSSAMSAAQSIARHIKFLHSGTIDGEYVSMGICSDNKYDLPNDLIFSLPVQIKDGTINSVDRLLNVNIQENFNNTLQELQNEYNISNKIV